MRYRRWTSPSRPRPAPAFGLGLAAGGRIIVDDDESGDGTAQAVERFAAGDPRVLADQNRKRRPSGAIEAKARFS
jgi:hypothetical protein